MASILFFKRFYYCSFPLYWGGFRSLQLIKRIQSGCSFDKAPALVEAKRALPLFMIQLQWADTRSLHLFIRTQRPCSNEKAPVPAVS